MPADTSILNQPEDESTPIWRYMSFNKYIAFLHYKSLYFSRIDLLGDLFEGGLALQKMLCDRPGFQDAEVHLLPQDRRTNFYVNCWHMNFFESDAMWKLYAGQGESICIQSRYVKLRDALDSSVRLGLVSYHQSISRSQDVFAGDACLFAMSKGASFVHEREVRALVIDKENGNCDTNPKVGINITIELPRIVEAIYVSPLSGSWFLDLVKASSEKCGYQFCIHRSQMESRISRPDKNPI